ncbi:MAG: excinuclease ABC subunit UvrC [Gemmatimonadetes bacterium]|nr:excinuclease ABC subunit UvrC [Gemmatimonadota bacterium]
MSLEPPEKVARKIAALPEGPGVYLWKNAQGRVIYVGKAKRLRSRVRDYFVNDYRDSPKHRLLLRQIEDLDTIVVPNEPQALLLENNLIKEYQPKFNIKLRDDKSYPRIAVTVAEPFPRVLVVRRLDIEGAQFFGPYTDVGVLRRTLRVIRRIFTVRSCHYDLPADRPDRPCLDYHIHRCLAPCVAWQSQADYRAMIDDVIAFLEGKTVEVRTRLRERMEEAAAKLEYERAAELRNAIRWLEQVDKPQTMEVVGAGDADAIGFARDRDDAVGVILRVRKGKVVAFENRFLTNLAEEPDEAVLSAFLVRYYVTAVTRGRRAVLPFAPSELDKIRDLLPETRWLIPQRGVNYRLVELADQNARHLLESLKIESLEADERVEDPVYALGRDLGMIAVPRDLVCIDISTNQGKDTVGSLVWFEGGRPQKAEYRRFKIKGEEAQQDDFAAVHEVVSRFVSRRVAEEKKLPDLMVIDGGKGQLNAAREALSEHGLDNLPLAAIAKRDEEIFLPGRKESIRLARNAPSLKLLQRARDEAHRFAVTYNRKRRSERTITSELLSISGVGSSRRRVLLERFGSLAGVRLATVEEIVALPGFSTRLAERILNHVST